uniref:Uncharacterized protein n=1 Tax=Arundo donax TaxID=35708 RepID=A0A0A9BYZ6_ARUDO
MSELLAIPLDDLPHAIEKRICFTSFTTSLYIYCPGPHLGVLLNRSVAHMKVVSLCRL